MNRKILRFDATLDKGIKKGSIIWYILKYFDYYLFIYYHQNCKITIIATVQRDFIKDRYSQQRTYML